MAEKKDKFFKTAEEKHKENVVLKCKVCGEEMKGKTTLSRHISHAHNNMDPVKRERIVIDTYYGKDKVDNVLRKYKNGEYLNKSLPIDIGRYIRLSGLNKELKQKQDQENQDQENQDNDKDTGKKVVEVINKKTLSSNKEKTGIFYVSDLKIDKNNKIYIIKTSNKENALSYNNIVKFIKKNSISDGILYVYETSDKIYPVISVKVKPTDEVDEDQIKCIVAYDSTKNSKNNS